MYVEWFYTANPLLSENWDSQLEKVDEIYLLLESIWFAKLRLQHLMHFNETNIAGTIQNLKFLPIFLACFVFPFRIGKSIYEIAAKKESKNPPESSVLNRPLNL